MAIKELVKQSESISRMYGLELTANSKTGFAFSLPRSKTCINATTVCLKLCYGRGIRYQSKGQKAKRERNFRTVVYMLEQGGPELLAENLLGLVDFARPLDFLSAKFTGGKTGLPWSFRIHDVGDAFAVNYVRAWYLTVSKRPECSFWLYTRSFSDKAIIEGLTELVSLPNCQGWLSLDSENYKQGLATYEAYPGWKLAVLQQAVKDMPAEMLPAITKSARAGAGDIVSFPYHHGGRHVEPMVDEGIVVCPQVLGAYPLVTDKDLPKPCQQCRFCLP
jgi:hypothetical protein